MHKNLFGEGHEQPPAATSQAVLIPPLVIMDFQIIQLYVIKMKPLFFSDGMFRPWILRKSGGVWILRGSSSTKKCRTQNSNRIAALS